MTLNFPGHPLLWVVIQGLKRILYSIYRWAASGPDDILNWAVNSELANTIFILLYYTSDVLSLVPLLFIYFPSIP